MSTDDELDYVEQCVEAIERAEAERTFGRPSVFTSSKVRKFLAAIERGNFIDPACHYAGLSYRTVHRWLAEGKADESESTPQWHFWHAVQQAAAIDEDQAVSRLQKVASEPRFYMADIIRLSRRHRERWAERTADELRAASAPSVQVLIGIAPPGTPQNPLPVTVQARQLPSADSATFASETPALEAKVIRNIE